jgi:predicted nucleic-acid-binding Zn-ribbon protein
MKERISEPRTCPKCGRTYTGRPALSRLNNDTLICPDCGTREALESMGVSIEEQDKILGVIHEKYQPE